MRMGKNGNQHLHTYTAIEIVYCSSEKSHRIKVLFISFCQILIIFSLFLQVKHFDISRGRSELILFKFNFLNILFCNTNYNYPSLVHIENLFLGCKYNIFIFPVDIQG